MFTGLVQTLAQVVDFSEITEPSRLQIQLKTFPEQSPVCGESVSVNGTCLTIINSAQELAKNPQSLSFEVSTETKRCSNLGTLKAGDWVNIEFALLPQTRLGGHIVSGHVDGLAEVTQIHPQTGAWEFQFKLPVNLTKYVVPKGSICLDGVSLTVNQIEKDKIQVMIVPHTWEHTTFQHYRVGSLVNIEVDLIARHIERLLVA